MTKDEFIKRAHKIHGNQYDYINLPDKVTMNTRLTIKCKRHEFIFTPTVRSHLHRKSGCRLCYNERTASRLTKNTEWFISTANDKHKNTYLYTKTVYVGTTQKVIITCKKHGDFLQCPNDHLTGYGCIECGYEEARKKRPAMSTIEFINKAHKVHNNLYSYIKTVYERNKQKVIITCEKHGDFLQTPNSHLDGIGCPRCKTSKGELAVLQFLINHNIPYEHLKHIKYEESHLWIDFIINKHIVIEIDGTQHKKFNPFFHKTKTDFENQMFRDAQKNQYCISHQLPLYRINYSGTNISYVINTLQTILQEHSLWPFNATNFITTNKLSDG